MDNSFYVYQLRSSLEEEPFYIGKGKGNRAYQHMYPCHLSKNNPKTNKIKKLIREGIEIVVEIIWEGLTNEEAERREVWAIHLWGRKDKGDGPLRNLTDGGEGGLPGFKHSDETKRKIALGNSNKVLTDEMKRKLDRTGYKHTEESRSKISKSLVGRKHSEETKAKIGAGQGNKTITEEGKKSQRDAVSKEYDFINPQGELVRVKNLTEFSDRNGLNRCCMTLVHQGIQKQHKGWRRYAG